MEIFWLSKVLCVDFEMFMFGAEQWSGWLGAKVRKKGMMRKFFILKEQKTILDVWHKRPEAIFTSGNALTTGDNWDPEAKQIQISRRSPTFLV